MRSLAKFARLPRAERVLVIRATAAILSVLYTVKGRSYLALRRRISTAPTVLTVRDRTISRERALQVVSAVARRIPGTSCLTNAIAAREVLAHYGYGCTLRVGVSLDKMGEFLAHSWLEVNGASIFGGTDSSSRYAALEIGPADPPTIKIP